MKKITLTDTTFRDAGHISFKEKIILAKQLATLNVDIIELGELSGSGEDRLLVKTIAPFVKGAVISAAIPDSDDGAAAVFSALAPVSSGRLVVSFPVSVVQIEYLYHIKPEKMLERIVQRISECRALTSEVEFCALDATRAERDFLYTVCKAAVSAGATYITLCDSEGVITPFEFEAFLKDFEKNCPDASDVTLYAECSDNLSMAGANSIAALCDGAAGVKAALVGNRNARLDELVRIISLRGEDLGISTGVDHTAINRVVSGMPWLFGKKNELSATLVEEAGSVDDIILTKGTAISSLSDVIVHMGYDLTSSDITRVYTAFERLAAKKPVNGRELETMIADVAQQVPPTYTLVSYIVNSGDKITPMAQVEIEKDGECRHGVSIGDGPIDAALLAIEQVIGTHYELDDFRISSVTRGQEALGEALVRLRSRGRVYSGSGVSTDIIGASINAYINALNKIVFEERQY